MSPFRFYNKTHLLVFLTHPAYLILIATWLLMGWSFELAPDNDYWMKNPILYSGVILFTITTILHSLYIGENEENIFKRHDKKRFLILYDILLESLGDIKLKEIGKYIFILAVALLNTWLIAIITTMVPLAIFLAIIAFVVLILQSVGLIATPLCSDCSHYFDYFLMLPSVLIAVLAVLKIKQDTDSIYVSDYGHAE